MRVPGLDYGYAGAPGINSSTGENDTLKDYQTRYHWVCPADSIALYPPEAMHQSWHTSPATPETRPVCIPVSWEDIRRSMLIP